MDCENILESLVRVGKVTTVDIVNRRARVLYEDKDDMMSGWLCVLQHPGAIVNVKESNGHDHDATVTYWMPSINDTVLVLYLPVFNGDGFILGVI